MKIPEEQAKKYKLPTKLNEFQLSLYIHLIEWKWRNITKEPGRYGKHLYDAILPESYKSQLYPLYRPIVDDVRNNHRFKTHKHFGHMASSQAACLNLFVPLLKNPEIANVVLCQINPNFVSLATEELEGGFQFEYWDDRNLLKDHTDAAGTDSDIAIAYYNSEHELCLWLIEHKLTEAEFTTCGGYRSKGNAATQNCMDSASVLENHDLCYYKYKCGYNYWAMTESSKLYKAEALKSNSQCPFIGGTNQLWRNQLMGYGLQGTDKFEQVHFSVVYHPANKELLHTINDYEGLLQDPSVFFSFTSKKIIDAVLLLRDAEIREWEKWYSDLYKIE